MRASRLQESGCAPGPLPTHGGQGWFCTTQSKTSTPGLLPKFFIRVFIPLLLQTAPGARWAEQPAARQAAQGGGAAGSWWSPERKPLSAPPPRASRPSPHKESLQPSPRSHVLPELVKDEAGLVRQLAGRHAAGTGATLRRGPASWHGAATSVPPGQGPRGAVLHMSLTTRLSKSRLDVSTICGCWGQHTAPGDLEPKPFMLRSSCSQAAEELYSY